MAVGSRLRTRVARLLAVVAVLVAAGAIAPGEAGATIAHPYSNPVWWPVNAAGMKMGCYHGNGPQCQNPLRHAVYAMELSAPPYSSVPVYSMGAGIAHVVKTGWACGQAAGRGNWLYVDHANGTYSEYGHLDTIDVHTGDLVTPQTELGKIGRSGYQRACDDPSFDSVRLVWLAIRHDSTYVHFTTSLTCVSGVKVTWPTTMSTFLTDDWNTVPAGTPIPSSTRTCIPAEPATPRRPTVTSFMSPAAGALRVVWSPAVTADHVSAIRVQLQKYVPAEAAWRDVVDRHLTGGYTRTTFTGLTLGDYRVRVWMANSVGWSAPSAWVSRQLG